VAVFLGHCASRTRLALDHRHLAKDVPGADLGKDEPHLLVNQPRNLHQAILHHVNAVPVVAFLEYLLPSAKRLLPGDAAQGAQFRRAELTKEICWLRA
jgi:hypothetical protein